jgi:WD40 repeat protein
MELTRPASYVFSTAFSPNGKYAFSGSLDNVVTIWDLETGNAIRTLHADSGQAPGVSVLSLSPNGNYLLTGMKGGGGVKLWGLDTGKEIRSLKGHSFTEAMEALAFSPDSSSAITGGSYFIKQWDVMTGRELGKIEHATFFDRNQSYAIAFSPDGRLAFVKGIGFISLWDIKAGRKLWMYGADTGGERGGRMTFNSSAQFSPSGEYILSGEGEILRLRAARSGQVLRTFVDVEEATGQIESVAYYSDGEYALAGSVDGKIRLWDVKTGAKIRKFVGHSDEVASVAFSRDGKHVLSGGDASTRLWDTATGEEMATMMEFGKGEWLVITSEGYYNASENGAQYLNVIAGENRYGVDKFYDVFYRPDLVAAKLRGEDIKDLITITMQDAIKEPPPTVEIARPVGTGVSAKVCYQIKSAGGGIGEVRLFHNGKLIQSDGYYRDAAQSASGKQQFLSLNSAAIYENMRSVSVKGRGVPASVNSAIKGESFADCREVEAVPGENEVSVAAFNGSNTVQSAMTTTSFTSKLKPEDPRLYVLSIGVDQYKDRSINLKYAVKDAGDIGEKLLKQSATIYKPQNIHYELLTDTNATKDGIIGKIDELSRKIRPNDGFILFIAGHVVLLQSQYYLLTSDFDGTMSNAGMINSNDIVEISKKIKSLNQLFIFDTCHAGGVDAIVSGLYGARMSVLAKKMGLHIYASASPVQEEMEGYEGNGLFSYALLEGLNNNKQADGNNDGRVSLMELGEYAKAKTAEIAKGLGHTQAPFTFNFGKDTTVYNLK